jgi:hypothetical protein
LNLMPRRNQFEAMADTLRPIGENAAYAEASEKLSRFNSEIAAARKEIDLINTQWYRAKQKAASNESAIDAADRLLDGVPLAADGDVPAKLRDLEHKLAILRPAAMKQAELVDHIRGELSAEAGRLVQAKHQKALLKILEAARALVATANAERGIRVELLNHGFEALESITPAPWLSTPLILGQEDFYDSAISHFKRQLEDLGIAS